jgi:hypothetical protein
MVTGFGKSAVKSEKEKFPLNQGFVYNRKS